MKFLLRFLSVFFSGILFISCVSDSQRIKERLVMPASGVIHPEIKCIDDTGIRYALYIPRKSDKILIAFDPHGDGKLPVTRYRELADEFNMVLMGSNDSKNGISPALIDRIVYTLYQEARTRFQFDSTEIFLAGFSGGARIVSMAAFYKIRVAGVIGCGAGFSGASETPAYKADYFGIAGRGDFNMNEMLELDYPLTRAGLRHIITTFEGIHEWPPDSSLRPALGWFELNAMRDGKQQKDTVKINLNRNRFHHKIQNLLDQGLALEAMEVAIEGKSFLEGLIPANEFQEQMDAMATMPEFIRQSGLRNRILEEEEKQRKALIDNIVDKDLSWWRTFARELHAEKPLKNPVLPAGRKVTMEEMAARENQFKEMRLLAFARILAYMNATSVMTSLNEEAAEKIVRIYEIVDPGNSEPYYLQAILASRKKDPGKTLQLLSKSVACGFHDRLRMSEQPEFADLKDNPEFYDIMQKIK